MAHRKTSTKKHTTRKIAAALIMTLACAVASVSYSFEVVFFAKWITPILAIVLASALEVGKVVLLAVSFLPTNIITLTKKLRAIFVVVEICLFGVSLFATMTEMCESLNQVKPEVKQTINRRFDQEVQQKINFYEPQLQAATDRRIEEMENKTATGFYQGPRYLDFEQKENVLRTEYAQALAAIEERRQQALLQLETGDYRDPSLQQSGLRSFILTTNGVFFGSPDAQKIRYETVGLLFAALTSLLLEAFIIAMSGVAISVAIPPKTTRSTKKTAAKSTTTSLIGDIHAMLSKLLHIVPATSAQTQYLKNPHKTAPSSPALYN